MSATASIAVEAALTGHLVLSTLHTNDAPGSLTRLVNIGLEPFLVGAAVNAVLAQRLKPIAWERSGSRSWPVVARAWVYRFAEKERLFVLFTQPLPSGFPPVVPDGLVEVDQPGRWELVNPRTLCFQPAEAALRFQKLLVTGTPQPVEGRES